MYNKRCIKLFEFDFTQNENSTFKKRDGSIVSYAQHVFTQYGVTCYKREKCVVKMGKQVFLPQCIVLPASNEMIGDDRRDIILQMTTPSIIERFQSINNFVNTLNNKCTSLKQGFVTSSQSIKVDGDVLPPVELQFFQKDGKMHSVPASQINSEWKNIGVFLNLPKNEE